METDTDRKTDDTECCNDDDIQQVTDIDKEEKISERVLAIYASIVIVIIVLTADIIIYEGALNDFATFCGIPIILAMICVTPCIVLKVNKYTIWFAFFMLFISFGSASIVQVYKPAIYLYTPEEKKDRVKVTIKGRPTTTIPTPDTTLPNSIEWSGLTLKNGKITHKENSHDYLFYEAENIRPKVGEAGWTLSRREGKLLWNGEETSIEKVADTFRAILDKYGLFKHEIDDFVEWWFGSDHKIFFEEEEFEFGIYPVEPEEVERILSLETDIVYPEHLRIHFYAKDIMPGTVLSAPEFPKVERNDYALHEWGIFR